MQNVGAIHESPTGGYKSLLQIGFVGEAFRLPLYRDGKPVPYEKYPINLVGTDLSVPQNGMHKCIPYNENSPPSGGSFVITESAIQQSE